MNAPKSRRKIPPLLLEQWLLGELTETQKQRLIAEFGLDELTRELNQLKEQDQQFWQQYGASSALPEAAATPQEELKGRRPAQLWRFTPLIAVAAAALLMLVYPRFMPESEDRTWLKGDQAALALFKKVDQGAAPVAERAILQDKDTIQIGYYEPQYPYGMIFSIDGRGHFTLHFPLDSIESGALQKGKRTFLNASYQLDDAPYGERFFFIRSPKPFNIAKIESEIMALPQSPDPLTDERLNIAGEFKQSSFLILKRTP